MPARPTSEADMISSAMPPVAEPRDLATTLAHIVARHAAERGIAIAVDDAERSLTYAELASLAETVGARLDALGAGTGPVGILLPASAGYVAAVVGLLARGVAYVPLDASFPAARNADIAARAGLKAVIVDAATAQEMRMLAPALPQIAMPQTAAPATLRVTASPDDVAVIFYTSGSTGAPKGVHQSQRNILYEVLRHCWRAGLVHEDRIALLYSPSVSGSTRDLYGSLAAGARLCVVDVKRQGLGDTTRFLADWRISVLHSIPGLFRSMFGLDSETSARLAQTVRLVHLISDRVLQSDVELYKRRFARACRLCIDLATTETYSYASWYLDHGTRIARPLVPVGYPRPDKPLRLAGETGAPVADGELGEIIVTGTSLSLGYWQDEALTRTRFVPSAVAGATDFRTGDMGRLLPNGLLEFIGRKDRQVKIRGNTVHLAEVEAALAACPGVMEAGAVARGAAPDMRLIVYCAGTATSGAVMAWCKAQLPVPPSEVVMLEALPRLPNGKPDGVALEKMDAARAAEAVAAVPARAAVPPSAAMRAVCDGWEEFLAPGSFDRDATFEESGGDSLKGLNLLLFLETRLGRRTSPALLTMASRPSEVIAKLVAPASDDVAPGAGDERPLLFLFPGMFGADMQMTGFAHKIDPRFAAVVVDYHWGGDDFAGTFRANALFETVAAIAARNRPRRVFLLGFSYGGKLAAEAARRLIEAGTPVDGVIVLDGVREDRHLRRELDARKGLLLTDRVRRGAAEHGGLVSYVGGRLARRVAVRLVSRGHYRALGRWMAMLAHPRLRRLNEQAHRAVAAHARLAAFAGMPDKKAATRLLLILSSEARYAPEIYPHLGWDGYFDTVEATRFETAHLEFLNDGRVEQLIAALSAFAERR
jgi:amino acid adenylation domain-containing protein